MLTFTHKAGLHQQLRQIQAAGKTIALVPTMGNLHAGHIALVTAAKSKCDYVVSTIFVNPLQFGANEDLDSYPRTLEDDQLKLDLAGCDCLFAPAIEEIYDSGGEQQTLIHVPLLSDNHCGRSRPGHFDGVATVVTKLFNIVQPDYAFFGLKDYQQFLIIQKMAQDLAQPVTIVGIETTRAPSGLALSSRNNYLTAEQKENAAQIYQCLVDSADKIANGDSDFAALESSARSRLSKAGIQPDYFSICNAHNLQAASEHDREIVILAAAYVGPSRLIDNIIVKR